MNSPFVEVATMFHVKLYTSIPVPTVYGYCKSEENPVGRPFIIMEYVSPVLLFSTRIAVVNVHSDPREAYVWRRVDAS